MSINYTPTTTMDQPPGVQPADSDAADAESVNAYLRWIGNRSEYLRRHTAPAMANMTLKNSDNSHAVDELFDVCFGAGAGTSDYGMFLAVGFSALSGANSLLYYTSVDGEVWTVAVSQTDKIAYGCAHGGSGALGSRMFVVVGQNATAEPVILTSADDAIGFTAQTSAHAGTASGLRAVVWNGTVWVAGGLKAGGVSQLETGNAAGDTWTARTAGSSYAGDVWRLACRYETDGDSRVIMIGTLGEIQTSDDNGVTWVSRISDPANAEFKAIQHVGGDVWVVSCESGSIYRSDDNGTTWTNIVLSAVPAEQLLQAYGECFLLQDGVLAYVCKHDTLATRYTWFSFDLGLTWKAYVRNPLATTAYFHAASASDGSRSVVVGSLRTYDTGGIAIVAATHRTPVNF